MRVLVAILVIATVLGASDSARADLVNVALGKPVSVVSGTTNGAALSTITDGVFRPRGTQWQSGTVWWSGDTILQIDFQGIYSLVDAKAQVDDNDAYTLYFHDLNTGAWPVLWNIPNYDSRIAGGMITRPDYPHTDAYEWHEFAASVVTDAVRLQRASGDNSYSASEVQLRGGTAIPEPGTILALGLGGLAAIARRKRL